jgi:nucleoside-diphosphate-sugar epimerase
MRVLVTGNEGYIGCILVPMLRQAGHEVVGLDTGLFRDCALGPIARPRTIRKDVRDVELGDLEGIEGVIHLAGLANDPLGDLAPQMTDDINHLGTVRLAELAKQAGVSRFLYASSCSVYGAAGDEMITETSARNPLTPYAKSKADSEDDLLPMLSDDFSIVFLRAATAYGVSPYLRFDLVLNNLVAWAHATNLVYLKSDGQAWRPIVHVEDIARAYTCLLTAPQEKVHGEKFNVGDTEENYRISELADVVQAAVPDARVEYAPNAFPDHRSYRVSCDKLKTAGVGYEAKWRAVRGAWEVSQAFQNWKIPMEEFEGPRYNRIAYLRKLLNEGRVGNDLRWVDGAEDVPLPMAQRA